MQTATRFHVWPSALVSFLLWTALAGSAHAQLERWVLEPELRVGLDDPEHSPMAVVGVAEGPEGIIAVLERGSVRLYDAGGGFRGKIDLARGEGGAVGWLADTLWISDRPVGSISYHSAAGELLATTPYASHSVGDGLETRTPSTLLPGNRAVTAARPPFRLGSEPEHRLAYLETDRAGTPIGPVYVVDPPPITLTSGPIPAGAQPFSSDPFFLLDGHGRTVVHVDRPLVQPVDQDLFVISVQVSRVAFSGDTLYSSRLSYTPTPVPAERIDEFVDRTAEWVAAEWGVSRSRAAREVREDLIVPPFVPAIRGGWVALDGSVWLLGQDRRTHVLAPDGQLTAALHLPPGLVHLIRIDRETVWSLESGGELASDAVLTRFRILRGI